MPATHVALLRGINLGGKNKIPMKDLAAMFNGSRCTEVKTFIQSGNVVFCATKPVAAKIAAQITKSIKDQFGFDIPVVLRTAAELAAVVSGNPFLRKGVSEDELAVSFLLGDPDPAGIARLDPHRSSPDEFIVQGREIYMRFPNGFGRSKLTSAWFDTRLKTVGTVRNWRTTKSLLQLMQG